MANPCARQQNTTIYGMLSSPPHCNGEGPGEGWKSASVAKQSLCSSCLCGEKNSLCPLCLCGQKKPTTPPNKNPAIPRPPALPPPQKLGKYGDGAGRSWGTCGGTKGGYLYEELLMPKPHPTDTPADNPHAPRSAHPPSTKSGPASTPPPYAGRAWQHGKYVRACRSAPPRPSATAR